MNSNPEPASDEQRQPSKRLVRARDRLNDAVHGRDKWSWSWTPSEVRKAELRIERLAFKAGRLEIREFGERGEDV